MDTLRGIVERITFHNEENGYTVAKLVPEKAPSYMTGYDREIAIVGNMPGINVGESLELQGKWTIHGDYGKQFVVERMRAVLPATIAGMEKYLGSGLIKGIGPVMAKRITATFGASTLDVIEQTPERLLETPGIGRKRVQMIISAWAEQRAIKEVMIFLQSHGVSTSLATKIYKTYGDQAIAIVKDDPYRLARDIYGIGFLTADKIAQSLGLALDAPQRVAAGVAYTLSQASDEGHVYLPMWELIKQTGELISVPPTQIGSAIINLQATEQVKIDKETRRQEEGENTKSPISTLQSLEERSPIPQIVAESGQLYSAATMAEVDALLKEDPPIYLTPFYYSEQGVANRLHRLVMQGEDRFTLFTQYNFEWERTLAELEQAAGIQLAPQQRQAIQAAMTNRLTVLTGGPGTGKCVHGETLISTQNGLVPIKALMPQDQMEPDTFLPITIHVNTRDGLRKATQFYYGGKQKTVRIATREGYELEGTPNHPIIVATSQGMTWMPLSQLKVGMFAAIQRTPLDLDPGFDAFAYFLGLFVGDGNADRAKERNITGVIITSADQEVWDFLEQEMPKMNFTVRFRRYSGKARMYYVGRFKQHGRGGVVAVMKEWGCSIATSRKKNVPTKILQGSHSQQRSFLQGIFDSDGSIDKRDGSVELGMSNHSLLRTIQTLLLNFGIIAVLRPKPQGDSWRLTIRGDNARRFFTIIGFRIQRKQKLAEMLSSRSNPNLDVIPCLGDGLLRKFIFQTGKHERKWWWKWKREVKGERLPHRSRVLTLLDSYPVTSPEAINIRELCNPNLYWAQLTSIEEAEAEVYDIHVPQGHEFIANGFVNHNTTVVASLIHLLDKSNKRFVLAAPTGRAAKRLAETTGREAKTIHRLLEFKPADGMQFQRNEENPLEGDLLIVDEASMLDLVLTNHLLKAVPPGMHLLLVGDIDQLPSVGAGNVLKDIINAIEEDGETGREEDKKTRGVSPLATRNAAVVRLQTIFRQEAGSYIITNAHRINQGQMPVIDNDHATDFFLFKTDEPERAAQLCVELVQTRIPRRFAIPTSDIQVLCPMHRGVVGVGALNEAIQAALNPFSENKAEKRIGSRAYRVGDRVMQIRNNYDKEVYNGDVGVITQVDVELQKVKVNIDGRSIEYDFLELDELVHAFAMSIHKAQGSEYPAVVIPVLTTHYMMLQRNLLYTGVTRAKRLVVLVGQPKAISMAVRNDKVAERFSGLQERIVGI